MTRRSCFLLALLALAVLPSAAVADGSARMTKTQYGKRWPLTVKSGTVHCSGDAVTFATDGANGRIYAVNGTALGRYPNMPKIRAIWRKDPSIPGARIDISPIIDRGLKLCGD